MRVGALIGVVVMGLVVAADGRGTDLANAYRVEFKTEMQDESRFTARIAPPAATTTTQAGLEFDHPLTRITRLRIAAGAALEVDSALPSLLVAFAPAAIVWDGAPAPVTLETGQTRWVAAGAGRALRNAGHTAAHLLRLEFKTPPAAR